MSRTPLFCILLISIAIAFVHLKTLESYPSYMMDESLTLQRVNSLESTGKLQNDLFQKLFDELKIDRSKKNLLSSYIFSMGRYIYPNSEVLSIRIISLLFGLVLLFAFYLIAQKLSGHLGATLTTTLIASSNPFFEAAHIARPDILGLSVAATSFALSLHLKKNIFNGLACGLLMGVAFELHERACIFGIVFFAYHLIDSKFRSLKCKWFWGYIFGGSLGLVAYYLIHIAPNSSALIDTVYKPRTSLQTHTQLINSLKTYLGIYFQLYKPTILFLPLMVFFPLMPEKKNLFRILVFTLLGTLASVGILKSLSPFKFIACSPFMDILTATLVAHFVKCSAISRILKVGIVVSFAFCLSILFWQNGIKLNSHTTSCLADFQKLGHQIRPHIREEDRVFGQETYWRVLKDTNYSTWHVFKFYTNYRNAVTLEDSYRHFKPDILIIDKFTDFFTTDSPTNNKFHESIRISKTEIDTIIEKYGSVEAEIDSLCYGNVRIVRFNWDLQ